MPHSIYEYRKQPQQSCTVELAMIVFVYYSDKFDFYVFALMHGLGWEPLCEPNFYVFLY